MVLDASVWSFEQEDCRILLNLRVGQELESEGRVSVLKDSQAFYSSWVLVGWIEFSRGLGLYVDSQSVAVTPRAG